ncbi:hypothetical protein LPJ74_002937 [Coemansia sp. RSA 1843]|nr:hypothetical protein LPJ74_002937 [Coemansia sp. RSA 1843]
MRMRGVQCYKRETRPPPPMLIWAIFSGFTSFLAILVLGVISKYGAAIKDHNLPFAIAPIGASTVLVFGVPSSPLAQPRNVIVGHMIAAVTGSLMHQIFKHTSDSFGWMPGSLSVGISIGLMGLVNCYHPPAGATAFIAGFSTSDFARVGWWFPLYPVLAQVLILVALGVLFNNVARIYPVYWFTSAEFTHQVAPNRSPTKGSAEDEDSSDESMASDTGTPSSSGSARGIEQRINDMTSNEADAEWAWMPGPLATAPLSII